MKVKVSCAQLAPVLCDKTANLKSMAGMIDRIMAEHPSTQLILFPELIVSGYECAGEFQNLAETLPNGESMRFIGNYAEKYKVHIIYGFPERDPLLTDVLYNSVALLGPDGGVIGSYRKVHLFGTEKEFFRAGCEYPVYDTEIGKIGMMICWDTAFPEVARSLALQGAELVAISTNWEKPYDADWDLVTRARAFDNTIYIAAANRVGFDVSLGFFGRSKIIGPLGAPIEELNDEKEGYIFAELDYDLPKKLKAEYYTLFKDRRPDTYDLLCQRY